ncbi:MAG: succinylglutamate desuccinylase/aspartoacylase family protein [Paracoccaceae bacterium]
MFKGVIGSIDFDRIGLSSGAICVPHSVDRSPYYQIRLPFWRLRAGDGPSILLLGGNHGDEYEGPVVLSKFLQAILQEDITGAITIFPCLNVPAVAAHARCSPFDTGNLNRSYPGKVDGTPTEQIAAFISEEIIPRHDTVFDFHAGGTSMAHIACGLTQLASGQELDAATASALRAMGLPCAFLIDTDDKSPTAIGQAKRAGKLAIGGEFGGGGSLTPRSMADTGNALENVLLHLGILKRRVISTEPAGIVETQFLAFNRPELFVYASEAGWCEPLAEIGDRVAAGQPALRMFDLLSPEKPPTEYQFEADGIVLARRLHAHTQPGDCLFALGAPL